MVGVLLGDPYSSTVIVQAEQCHQQHIHMSPYTILVITQTLHSPTETESYDLCCATPMCLVGTSSKLRRCGTP